MNLAHDCRAFLLAAAVFSSGISLASGQLESCIESHGGLATWKSFGSVRYELTWTSAKGTRRDEQMFDLRTRDGLIKSDAYTLGSSGGAVWIQPSLDALGGTPPRFYMWTPSTSSGCHLSLPIPALCMSPSAESRFRTRSMMPYG